MAHMFSRAFSDSGAMALWYHFAIMFEALFILTTIDAGTRVGRFLLQELLGKVWKPLADTQNVFANGFASLMLVGAWGVFLYQGVVDPLGGVNSLWPIFGIANQLLAVLGLGVGTTLLIKMNKARYAAITIVPLLFLTVVTYSAGFIKVFASDPKLGFLSAARDYAAKASAAPTEVEAARFTHLAFNMNLDVIVTLAFLALVSAVLIGSVWEWIKLLRGMKPIELRESPCVLLAERVSGF
jgi:carbon starvation protein